MPLRKSVCPDHISSIVLVAATAVIVAVVYMVTLSAFVIAWVVILSCGIVCRVVLEEAFLFAGGVADCCANIDC